MRGVDKVNEFSLGKYEMVYTLKQITPMIHFQHGESGTTLRASEVKPKLDRFIIDCFGGVNKLSEKHSDWIDIEHKSLMYKMKFDVRNQEPKKSDTAEAKISGIKPKTEICKSYFGNMVQGNDSTLIREKYKETVMYENEIEMTIISKYDDLISEISKHIIEFFLLHNFGTRQNKGFGSFMITEIDSKPKIYDAKKRLIEYGVKDFFYINYDKPGLQKQKLNDIALIYDFMKGGINYKRKEKDKNDYFRGYIFRYFHDKEIGNDKAFIKQEVLAEQHKSNKRGEKKCTTEPFRYVRGLLGICDVMNFRYGNAHIHNFEGIERFASPILFKVVDKYTLIIPQVIPNKLFGATFYILDGKITKEVFEESPQKYDKFKIQIPLKDELAKMYDLPKDSDVSQIWLVEFLNEFRKDFNDKSSKKGGEFSIKEAQNFKLRIAKTLIIEKAGECND